MDSGLGSLLPPGGADWPSPDDLAAVLPRWIAAAAGDKNAIDIYCAWATMNDLPAARVLDDLAILITDPEVSSQLWRIAELFEQLRTQQRFPVDDSRMYRWIDQFAANGDRRFQRMQQDPD